MRTGFLLGLIGKGSSKWESSMSSDRVIAAMSHVKRHWGEDFFWQLHTVDIFLQSRMSRHAAELLSRIAKSNPIEPFSITMKAILQEPRPKGKVQEQVPTGRVVQAEDLRKA